VISLTLDREDLDLIIDFMRVGVSTTKEIIEAESQVEVSLALRLQHEVDQAEAVLEQLENME
jgi:hypothetical protein